ncbi:hypothetical protein [Limibacterium fermenti]|uniref:hypothetical protein n=1 Tax=Limibacterium fermenti TaxID=3229863 RepID=UPI000E9DB305|nr:hypothetical protein [Porphyromonadaceae bacterium]
MGKGIAKKEVDFSSLIENARCKNELKILEAAIKYHGITGDIKDEDIAAKYEHVRHYGVGIYTLRYQGKLLFRRFRQDMEGIKFRYESPIFNNVTE